MCGPKVHVRLDACMLLLYSVRITNTVLYSRYSRYSMIRDVTFCAAPVSCTRAEETRSPTSSALSPRCLLLRDDHDAEAPRVGVGAGRAARRTCSLRVGAGGREVRRCSVATALCVQSACWNDRRPLTSDCAAWNARSAPEWRLGHAAPSVTCSRTCTPPPSGL
jgi:hypothetical protein